MKQEIMDLIYYLKWVKEKEYLKEYISSYFLYQLFGEHTIFQIGKF